MDYKIGDLTKEEAIYIGEKMGQSLFLWDAGRGIKQMS